MLHGTARRPGCSETVKGASFSADGTSVVFASGWTAPGSFDEGIYLIDADGGTLELLLAASRGHQLSYPTLSPDGAQIAYIDGQGDLGNSLRVMNADGSDVHVLGRKGSLGGHTIGLSWSPDGTRLAVGVRYIGPSGIYLVDADGSGVTLLIDYRVNPYWSPDGLPDLIRVRLREEDWAPDRRPERYAPSEH